MNEQDLINRREFITGSALVVALSLVNQEKSSAGAAAKPLVRVGVIGTGLQGQNLIAQMMRLPDVQVVALCDVYPPNLKKGQDAVGAKGKPNVYSDYRQLLDKEKTADAVFIATPPHTHKDISLAAIQAGKHVYCEAPLTINVDDGKAIVRAAEASPKIFQVGHHQRSNPMYHHVWQFIRTKVVGADKGASAGRAQWSKKTSWRRPVSNRQFEKLLNWKLYHETSPGLLGEVGSHQLDVLTWFLKKPPISVMGWSGITLWDDGRETPDTVQCLFEYPNNVVVNYSATLANSHDGIFEQISGADGAIVLRDDRAWLFKEADSTVLGWEVYARKEVIGDEEGIALVADATKLIAQGKIPGQHKQEKEAGKNSFFHAVEEFVTCIRENKKPTCGAKEGLQAAVVAVKANEAARTGTKVVYKPEWFVV
jgi:predicted dehydrogenase